MISEAARETRVRTGNGRLDLRAGCRRDVCCIGAGHKGGNECDKCVVHNKGTVQIYK